MKTRLLKTVTLLAFAWSTLALAQEPPSRVGRIAVTQGQVTIGGASGQSANVATVNWPVAPRDLVTTANGARTELRFGSTTVRIEGDSSLEVTELDDDNMRLRLHYGSASVRVVNPEVLGGFELSTPQGRARMQEPGRLRVDAERVRDTTSISVFEGVALVEGGGASLTVRAGKRAELHGDDIRTAQAVRDAFDDWGIERDQSEATSASSRYVSTEMTGREDLDRYGSWSMDNEYGALWTPTARPGWEPYRDGRYVWIQPWGWTWVDNAPWGYAPFHYGSWVYVHKRWAWAPGHHRGHRPVWQPHHRDWRRDGHRGRDHAGRDHRGRPPVTMPPPVLSPPPPQSAMPKLPPPRQPITILTPPPLQVQPAPQPQHQPGWRHDKREQFEDGRRGRHSGRWTETEVRPTAVAPPPVHAQVPMPAAVAPQPAVAPNPMPASVAQRPMPQPQPTPVPRSVAQPVQMPPPAQVAVPAPGPAAVQGPGGPNRNAGRARMQER